MSSPRLGGHHRSPQQGNKHEPLGMEKKVFHTKKRNEKKKKLKTFLLVELKSLKV